jgi:hypothetical protein
MHVVHHAAFAHAAHTTHAHATSLALSLLGPLTHAAHTVLALHRHLLLLSGGRSSVGWGCRLLSRRTK